MSINPLAVAIAAGLEAARTIDEEVVRRIVREELAALRAEPQRQGYATPPCGAKSRGVSIKRVYALMDAGQIEKRAKNPKAKHPKWEISLASLDAALRRETVVQPPEAAPVDAMSWARARLAKKGAA